MTITNSLLFDRCIPVILEHEGGFVNNIHDAGGATKYGISLRFLKGIKEVDSDGFLYADIDHDGDVDVDDIKKMNVSQAKEFYYKYFWNKIFDTICCANLALHLFDMGVNAGTSRATKLIQRIVGTKEDGLLGATTIGMINKMDCNTVTNSYMLARKNFYKSLVVANPKQDVFLKGWLARIDNTILPH